MNRKALAVAWGYMGAVIGAGFASGQELVQFFVCYGQAGVWGTALAGVLFGLYGGLLLLWVDVHGLDNYQSVLRSLFGRRCTLLVDILLALFLFLGVCTMFAASGAVFYEHINQSQAAGVACAYLGVVIFLFTGRKGMVKSFNLLVPIKFLLLLTVASCAVLMGEDATPSSAAPVHLINPAMGNWVLASLLYVAYNFSLAMVVLAEYQPLTGRRDGIKGASVGGLMLGVVALVCYFALVPSLPAVVHYEVPMLYVAGLISSLAKVIYTVVLWIGILTAAIANAYGFAQRLSDFSGLGYNLCLILTATMALPLAFKSFAFLVATVYPLLGLLGIVIMAALTVKSVNYAFKAVFLGHRFQLARIFKGV